MAEFVNNEPKFKVGDKVVYSRRQDYMSCWEKESIRKGTLTIRKVSKLYENGILTDVTYFVDGLDYAYSENWLSYAPAGPKFKIGDKVRVNSVLDSGNPYRTIEDIIICTHQKIQKQTTCMNLADSHFLSQNAKLN